MEKQEIFIIQKLRSGDKAAFHTVYKQYYSKLLGISKKYPSYWLEPEDFIQETFIQLYKYKDHLKENISLDIQLKVICKSVMSRFHLRDQKYAREYEIIDNIKDENDEELDSFLQNRVQELMKTMENLPSQQRDMLMLHKINNYNYEEIEELTGLSKKTIANHIYLAKKKLVELLNPS